MVIETQTQRSNIVAKGNEGTHIFDLVNCEYIFLSKGKEPERYSISPEAMPPYVLSLLRSAVVREEANEIFLKAFRGETTKITHGDFTIETNVPSPLEALE